MTDINNLSEIQLDALKETGNIGCSHAATAVSKLISKKIDISVPDIQIKETGCLLDTITAFLRGEQKLVGVYLELTQPLDGSIMFVFPYSSALAVADMLMGREVGTTDKIGDMEKSALMEVGNIVVSAYTTAIGKFLRTQVLLTPPLFTLDMPNAVIDNVLGLLGKDTTHAFIFDTRFNEEHNLFRSYFVLLPSPSSLDLLLDKLHVLN